MDKKCRSIYIPLDKEINALAKKNSYIDYDFDCPSSDSLITIQYL